MRCPPVSQSRQKFNETFKEETVRFVQEQTKSLPQIAEELNIPVGTLRQWMGKYRKLEHEPIANGDTIREQAQLIQQQEQEITEMKMEIDILKKAMHIFSKARN
jgi:transposase